MRLTVKAVPPFDFGLSALVFSGGDRQIRRYENGRFWQVIRIGGKLVLIIVEASGSVEEPELLVEMNSDRKITRDDRDKVGEIVCSLFNLDFDLKPFYEGVRGDVVMAKVTSRLWGLRSPTTATVFEALIDSIVEQQISLNVAHVLEGKVIRAFGDALRVRGEVFYVYPTPARLASATVSQLRACGLSERKSEYVRNVSRMVADGVLDLERVGAYDDANRIIGELDEVRGIGVWTAELTMVRGMRRLDVVPADDLGLRRVMSHFYGSGRMISGEEARRIAEKWGAWKGLASFYLIVAGTLGIRPQRSD